MAARLMRSSIALISGLLLAAPAEARTIPACPGIQVISSIDRFSQLPSDIRNDLLAHYNRMARADEPLLATDAPNAAEEKYPTSRFVRAVLIKNVWYVQMEVAMTPGVRTIGYILGPHGHLERSAIRNLGGPACETLRAINDGIYNPGPPNR